MEEKLKYNKNFTLCSHNTDFEPRIRDAVIDYMVERFGSEYVSAIGTFGVTRTKVAIQDVGRVFGIPAQETLGLTKQLKDADDDAPLEQLEEEYPILKKYLDKWEGEGYNLRYYINGIRNAQRNISQHAAGVLVSSDKLMDNVALVQSRKRVVTGWQEGSDYHELSDLGYYKYDILGLNNLQVVNDSHALIKKRRGVDIDWESLDLNEKFVYENVVHNHDHYGTFQFESPLARKLMKDIMPDNFEELSAVSSLLRPGPLRMGMHTEFADRKHGRKVEGKDYDIPECIRNILGYTFGIIVYQEQFMQIATQIGGLSAAETNAFRKALVKYGKSAEQEAKRYAQVQSYHDLFVETASKPEYLGDKLKAEELWQLIASFAAYGFNKSLYCKELVEDRDRGMITLEEVERLRDNGEEVWVKSADEDGNDIWVEVIDAHDHGELGLVDVELEDGKKIRCTLDHKFMTTKGMQPLREIITRRLDIIVED